MRIPTLVALCISLAGQAQVAINGPMPGHIDLMQASIWMQCQEQCTAKLEYWPTTDPKLVASSTSIVSDATNAHAMEFALGPLEPGTEYGYRVVLASGPVKDPVPLTFRTQPIWRFRVDPPEFTVAMGSCAYINEPAYDRPGKPFGSNEGIFDAIADKRPDLMLWLGDNVYLREPDFGSRSGFLHRYTHTRSFAPLQRLLRTTQHYATWDDHDFGPNDSKGSFVQAPMAQEVFDLFWSNPTTGAPGVPGITTAFTHLDIDFFLLDGRTYRTHAELKTMPTHMLGKAHIDWLIQALKYSDAPFKLIAVGSQILNTGAVFENFATYPDERAELLRRIEVEGIRGVVFLTGDRHFSELSALPLPDGRIIHDLTVSPLTAGVYSPKEKNELQVPGTLVEQHNFATLTFNGPKGQRVMTIKLFDATGALLWERAIPQEKKP